MTPGERDAVPDARLLGSPRAKARIGLACAVVLGIGAWMRPEAPAQTALSTPPEHAAPLLEQQVQARTIVRSFEGVGEIAARVAPFAVIIPRANPLPVVRNDFLRRPIEQPPEGLGIALADGIILTHASALKGRTTVEVQPSAGSSVPAELAAYESVTGLVMLRAAMPPATIVPLVAAPPRSGSLTVAAARWAAADVAVPVFVISSSGTNIRLGRGAGALLPGMPIFDLDGRLFALASGEEENAIAVDGSAARLTALAAAGGDRSIGAWFQDLQGRLTEVFGSKGVLITEVVAGGPAAAAGLGPGDVVLAINDARIATTGDLDRALAASSRDADAVIQVMRDGKERAIAVRPGSAFAIAALEASQGTDDAAPAARVLFAPEALAAAGIQPSARVLMVGGSAVTSRAQADRARRGTRPVPVLLSDGGRHFFAVVEAAR